MGDFVYSIESREREKSKNFIDSVYLWLANKNNNKESNYFSFSQFVKNSCFFTINISKNLIVDFHVGGIGSPIDDIHMSHMKYDRAYKNLIIHNIESPNKRIASDFFDIDHLFQDYEEGRTYQEEHFEMYIGANRKKHKICINRQLLLRYDTKDIYAFFLLLENKNEDIINNFQKKKYELKQLENKYNFLDKENYKDKNYNNQNYKFIEGQASDSCIKEIDEANIDKLTKLYNMYKFNELATDRYKNAIKNKNHGKFALLFIDMNGFKYFNEEFGFYEGDLFLKYIAEQLQIIFKDQIVARLYDDHFVVFTDHENILSDVVKLNSRIKKYHANEKVYLKVGIYKFDEFSSKDIIKAIDKAKLACQNVKSRCDITYCYYDEKVAQREKKEHYIITNIDNAIKNEYIEVYFQPVVRTLTGELCGWEALTRWRDPIYGMINPVEFVDTLEKAHLIQKIDTYVIKKVCQKYVELKNNNDLVEPVSINLSKLDFELCDILDIIQEEVKKSGIPKALIHFEITESIINEKVDVINNRIIQIQNAGYQVWMDDFGSGYSSFNSLKDFNFDFLKIDMKFLEDFEFNDKTKIILASIVNMAKQLSIGTLAEGVETETQAEFLKSIGCEKMQGFLYGKPLPYHEAVANIEKKGIKKEVAQDVAYNVIIDKINLLNSNPLLNINLSDSINDFYILRDYKKEFNDKTNFAFSSGFPLALVEYHKGKIRYILANNEYMNFLKDVGSNSLEENEMLFNNGLLDSKKGIIEIAKNARKQKEEKSIDYVRNGYLCNLTINYIASNIHRKTHAYLLAVTHSLYDVGFERGKWLSMYTKKMFSMFICIDLINVRENRIENLYYNGMSIDRKIIDNRFDESVDNFIETNLYPKEKKQMMDFFNFENTEFDFQNGDITYKEQFFRVKKKENMYDWFTFWLVYQKGKKNDECLLFIKNTSETIKKLLENRIVQKEKDYNKNKINDEVLRNVLELSNVGIFWKDKNRRFIDVNDYFLNFYGISDKDEIIGKTDEEMGWHINEDGPKLEEIKVIKDGESVINHKLNCIVKGTVHELIINKRPLYVDGEIVGLIGGFKDNFYDEKGSLTINKLAVTDELTEVFNRRGFIEMLDKYEREYSRKKIDFVLFYIDVDDFKYYNDTFGHQFGDKVLKTVAAYLRENYGSKSVIARIGGDEFAIIRQSNENCNLYEIAREIHNGISAIKKIDYVPCKIRLSIGFAKFSETISLNKLINVADVRMYENKMRKKKINDEIKKRKNNS
ncbi:EAL domain-containing protein [Lachnobacterium bovis]|uniref:EAL domain-containing protein n=1 Tax=Lachnobacterium bovis TaxID=140626 RepID=UPI000685ED36|nr:EAL domain-containing protein [Lachnobacterium bovis]